MTASAQTGKLQLSRVQQAMDLWTWDRTRQAWRFEHEYRMNTTNPIEEPVTEHHLKWNTIINYWMDRREQGT